MTDTDDSGFRVFISYAHGDEDYRVELEKHLALLQNQGVLSVWQDRQIAAGDEFDEVIAAELDAADIILLLVSVNFLASKYCWQIEQTRALERHEEGSARVIPIILKHCDNWQSAPFGKLTAAPTDGVPIEDFPSWDKGFTDVTKAIRLAATQLRVKRETEHEPKANGPATGPGGFFVPHERNVHFTGRVDLLERLHRELSSGEPAALVQALSGLGGIGKSQTAIEYAYRHKGDYRLVWWLRAEEPATLAADYASLAKPLGLDVSQDQAQAIAAVRDRLDQEDSWLLIFDNAPDAGNVRRYLPLQRRGRVIVTSRNPNWGGVATPVRVELMDEAEAVALLLRHRQGNETDDAKALAAALGFLPLALAQASAYCEHVGCTLRAYLDLLKAREAELLAQPHVPDDYPVPVAAAWDLAFETIQETPGAADLLNLLAFLAPDALPKNLLVEHADQLQDDLSAVARDPFKLGDAIAALRRASLIETVDETLSMHRLVQTVAHDRCRAEHAERDVAGAAIRLVNAALPDSATDYRSWPLYGVLLAHALKSAHRGKSLEIEPAACSRVFDRIATYHQWRGSYTEAEPLFVNAVNIAEKKLAPDHPNLAASLNNLAVLFRAQGRYDEALPLYERAIEIGEKKLGPDHPDLAMRLNNLANLHRDQGRYDQALPLFERAIEIGEKTLGPDHPKLAIWLNNLANLHRDQGHYDQASPLYQRDIAITEKSLGPDHPDLAISLNNLANLHHDQGRYDLALPLFERALSIFEAKLPPEHPHIEVVRENYEACLRAAGEGAS